MNETRNPNGPILGRYQTISELAKSRFGGLMLALDLPERRIVALRSLPVEGKFTAEAAEQLLDAGHWVKGLEDPSVMTPLEVGTQEGLLHAAYLYSVAEPLRGILRLTSFKGQAMPVGVALRIAHDVALGARAVEACGAPPRVGNSLCGALVPDSVLVGQDGRTRLCDVGLGAVLRRKSPGEHPDVLAYAAPEQADLQAPTDGRTDVFTIGIFLWEMLANRKLYASLEAGKPRLFEAPPIEFLPRGAADSVPSAVAAIVKRALAPLPADRHPGTTALLQAIESQCRTVLAPHSAVQSFMGELFGSIFENRSRSIESVLASAPLSSRESATAPPVAVREVRSRAAAPIHEAASAGAKARVAPVSSSNGNLTDVDPDEALGLEGSPDTVREAPPSHELGVSDEAPPSHLPPPPPPVRSTRPAPVFGHKQPVTPALPGLPKQFELPGAELFAAPGLPLAVRNSKALGATNEPAPSKPEPEVAPVSAAATRTPLAEEPSAASVNPVVPTIPAPANIETIESPELADLLQASAAASTAQTAVASRRRSKIAWPALLSIVAVAFVGGVAVRRCTKPAATVIASRVEAPVVTEVSVLREDAGALGEATAVGAVSEAIADAAVRVDAALATSAALDAGAPGASSSDPAVSKAPAPAPVRRNVAAKTTSSSKVVKGRGKTTRSH